MNEKENGKYVIVSGYDSWNVEWMRCIGQSGKYTKRCCWNRE